jgi:hypothetical protein
VVKRISEGIDMTSRALGKDYSYAPAWMLKGRYHLACMEVDAALQAFSMASQCPARRLIEGKPALSGAEDPRPMIEIAVRLQQPSGDRMSQARDLLARYTSRENNAIAIILNWMKGKPGISTYVVAGSTRNSRLVPTSERLVDFITSNGGTGKIDAVLEASTHRVESLSISGIREIFKFDNLKSLTPGPINDTPSSPNSSALSIKIRGAEVINWESLSGIPIKSLDLEECQIGMIAENIPIFKELRTISLKGIPEVSLGFLKRMQAIEKLDISGTKISDLTPLQSCRNLRELDASGLVIENIGGKLFPSSLVRVTITPSLIPPQVLKALREIRSISVLRQPEDPWDQSAKTFWAARDAERGQSATQTRGP